MIPRLLPLLALSLLAASLGACTSGFDSKWRAAAGRPADAYSGRWAGEWKSTRGTHQGTLECVLTKAKPPQYTANFHAHWGGLSDTYAVTLQTVPVQGALRFSGQKNLGPLQGGTYKYDGLVTARRFSAHYDSKYDTGVFELHRVPKVKGKASPAAARASRRPWSFLLDSNFGSFFCPLSSTGAQTSGRFITLSSGTSLPRSD